MQPEYIGQQWTALNYTGTELHWTTLQDGILDYTDCTKSYGQYWATMTTLTVQYYSDYTDFSELLWITLVYT